MSDYLLLVMEDERAHASSSRKAIAEAIAARARFADSLTGRLREHGRFRPSAEGKRIARGGVVDGPFGAPVLAAYYWVDAASAEEAARLGASVPRLASDVIDVRPVMKGVVDSGKLAKPGKIFGFAVLGAGATEADWTAVMDRIDAETHDSFPADAFAGGNRLRPARRATFDGPFMEAKEVIGGVFFLRMLTIQDAVRWAAASRFVVHGALEIRELWRS